MTHKPLLLTQADYQTLSDLLEAARRYKLEDGIYLAGLAREIEAAVVIPSDEIPADVVTLHTRMKLEFPGSQRFTSLQVVLPAEVNVLAGRVSVLSPLGTALIGRRAGSDIEYQVRDLPRRVRIAEILYQPESDARKRARRDAVRLVS